MEQTQDMLTDADADAEWRATLPPALRPVAERHGRQLFELALNCLGANERLGFLAHRIRAAEAQLTLNQLAQMVSNLAAIGVSALGTGEARAKECMMDIQRAVALAQEADGRAKDCAIILPAAGGSPTRH